MFIVVVGAVHILSTRGQAMPRIECGLGGILGPTLAPRWPPQ